MEILDKEKEKVILAGVHTGRVDYINDTTDESIAELEELVETAGGEVICSVIQNKSDLEAGTYMGEGKLMELKEAVEFYNADMVVFDDELSPVQTRNITDLLGVKVLDRSLLILDIFAMRAKSGEGKLQVELAQLRYRLPRLRGLGTELSRMGAGIGTRGPGESRLESDRRHIMRRIGALESQIKELKKHRSLIHERRRKDGTITAALVGYTNVGKSTLLNALTDAQVFAEDKLFATLDPTSRAITLDDNRQILLVDTVGFIRKLPHHLIEAFKSTLEEAVVADVIIHVIDSSSPEMDNQIKVVETVLNDIGASGKPELYVFNKCDKNGRPAIMRSGNNVYISAKTHENLDGFIAALADTAPGAKKRVKAVIPYSEGQLVSELHDNQKVISENYGAEGTEMELMVDEIMFKKIHSYLVEE